MEKKKEIKLTKEMQEKYDKRKQFFYSRTKAQAGVRSDPYLSFTGLGILKESAEHLIKKANQFWLYAVGLNRDGTDVEEAVNCELTITELLALRKAIDDLVDIYVNKFGGVIPDINEGWKKQKAKLEKEINFKWE